MQVRQGSHFHNPNAATQNCGNSLGSRPSVRISQLYLRDNSGDALKAIIENQDPPSPRDVRPRSCSYPVEIHPTEFEDVYSPSYSAPANVWSADDPTTGRNNGYSQWHQPIERRSYTSSQPHAAIERRLDTCSQPYAATNVSEFDCHDRSTCHTEESHITNSLPEYRTPIYHQPVMHEERLASSISKDFDTAPRSPHLGHQTPQYYGSYMSPYEGHMMPETSYHTPTSLGQSNSDRYQDMYNTPNSSTSGIQQMESAPKTIQRPSTAVYPLRSDHHDEVPAHRPRTRAELHRAKKHEWFKGSQVERALYGEESPQSRPNTMDKGHPPFTPSEQHRSRNLQGNGDIICWSTVG